MRGRKAVQSVRLVGAGLAAECPKGALPRPHIPPQGPRWMHGSRPPAMTRIAELGRKKRP